MAKGTKQKIMGGHYILDFFGCDTKQLNSLDFWKKNLTGAAKAADMQILKTHFHKFEPHGLTGFLLLSTSHISIHTWPEHKYVACDVFSCSTDEYTRKAVNFLKKNLKHAKCEMEYVDRGEIG